MTQKFLTLHQFRKLANCKWSEIHLDSDGKGFHAPNLSYRQGQFTVLHSGYFGTGNTIENAKRNAEWSKNELEQIGW